MVKYLKKIAMILAVLMVMVSVTACDNESSSATETITFWGVVDQYTSPAFAKLVSQYNSGQGVIDGVTVKFVPKTDNSINALSFCTGTKSSVDIFGCNDQYFFSNVDKGCFVNLDTYLADESLSTKDANGNYVFDINDIAAQNIDRYRFNRETKTGGEGENLYALPVGNLATVLYYNEDYLKELGCNIISIPEEDLVEYNSANGTKYAARGYCEYTVDACPASNFYL